MEILNVTQHDEAALLNIATEAIQDQITPILTELGRATMKEARLREASRVCDPKYYSAVKAVIDGEIAGYVAWTPKGKVAHLYVDPSLQCGGVGGTLLRHSISELSGQEVHLRASINSVAFYEKQGFIALGCELVDAGIRYVPMALPLQGPGQLTLCRLSTVL
jgi:predicted N-acetyltransferase YhbS